MEKGERRDYTLSEYRGPKVVLAFYPGDNTPGCTIQMCSYRDDFDEFEEAGAVVLGISPQDVDSNERWCEREHFQFPLLADTEKTVIEAYGVAAPVIGVKRSVFADRRGGCRALALLGRGRARSSRSPRSSPSCSRRSMGARELPDLDRATRPPDG